jgi:DNA-binding MarR family transcriptional regulator
LFTWKRKSGIFVSEETKEEEVRCMDFTTDIIDALTRVQERSHLFGHGREDVFKGINLAEVHCIDWIGTIDRANVTKIARKMGLTKGAVCKISKKLVAKGFIQRYQGPENNKEIYYRLTEEGRNAYFEHKKCHSRSREDKLAVLAAYSGSEQAAILRFLTEINKLAESKLRGVQESSRPQRTKVKS